MDSDKVWDELCLVLICFIPSIGIDPTLLTNQGGNVLGLPIPWTIQYSFTCFVLGIGWGYYSLLSLKLLAHKQP